MTSPHWWRAYNKVKHRRDTDFHRAHLKNVLNSFAGLFCLLIYLYGNKSLPPPEPQMFSTARDYRDDFVIFYSVPDANVTVYPDS